jgi:DNA end-binding protein Ku
MPARAMGSATLSFGLVSIPIKLFSAHAESGRVSMHWLHEPCGSRLKQQYVCPEHSNKQVPKDEMIKGYEFAKGQYVRFRPDELKALEEKPTQTVEIVEFLPVDKVDLAYYDKSYYLGPDKGAERAYRLLGQAMHKRKRVALARYAARGKQYLVMVRAEGEHLVMQQLHYADEVKPIDEVPVPKVALKDGELDLAVRLIDQITSTSFNPQNYEDDVKKRVEEAVQQKVEGQEITLAPVESPKAQVVDLMAALKASLGGGDGHKPAKRIDRAGKKSTTKKKSTGKKSAS